MAKFSVNAAVFLGGLFLAVVLALAKDTVGIAGLVLMLILGLGVGVLNVTKGERLAYMVATIGLFTVTIGWGSVVGEAQVGAFIDSLLNNIAVFAGASALPVFLMTLYNIGSRR